MTCLQSLNGVADLTSCTAARDRLIKALRPRKVRVMQTPAVCASAIESFHVAKRTLKYSFPHQNFLQHHTNHGHTNRADQTMETPTHLCTMCSKPATSVCAGCTDGRDATGDYLTSKLTGTPTNSPRSSSYVPASFSKNAS